MSTTSSTSDGLADPGPRPVVTRSEELFAPVSRDVELCYQTFGDPSHDTVLLVMGLGGPMNWWTPAFCELLADRGFHVVRFDNRDTGRSSRGRGKVARTALVRAFLGTPARAPYSLDDLADDCFGLLDHLGVERAHVVGVSMGGMIAQSMAVARPARVRSLVSIMSTTGQRTVGWQSPALLPQLALPRRAGKASYVTSSVSMWRAIGSPGDGLRRTREEIVAQAEETYDRGVSIQGLMRQMMAILTATNRSDALRRLRIPAAVVHGDADKMVHLSGGRATAAAIPDAELLVIEGMGHDLPAARYDVVVETIERTARRARA